MKTYSADELQVMRDRHEAWLMAQPGIIGMGIGLGPDGKVCLRIFTNQISAATHEAVCARLSDVPMGWEEGEVIPYAD